MKNKKIIGERYALKPFVVDDISEKYIEWLNDAEVTSFLEIRNRAQTYESVKKYIDSFYDGSNKYLWGIYTRSGKHIGTVNIGVNKHKIAELGLMIGDKNYWGSSASSESISLVLDFAFNALEVRQAGGGCYSTNIGIVFTFKKLGFSREKILKNDLYDVSSKYAEIYRWVISHKEWNRC